MTYTYKGYNPANSKHVVKYAKGHYKQVVLCFDKSFYNDELKPVCDALGVPVATFIKKAVDDALLGITKK